MGNPKTAWTLAREYATCMRSNEEAEERARGLKPRREGVTEEVYRGRANAYMKAAEEATQGLQGLDADLDRLKRMIRDAAKWRGRPLGREKALRKLADKYTGLTGMEIEECT